MSTRKKSINRDEDGLPKFKTGEEFDALSPQEKEKVWNYYDRLIRSSELRDHTPEEAAIIAKQRRHHRKSGRPKVGKGAKMVAVTIELGLLNQADAFAKKHGMKRAEMVAKGLLSVMGEQ